VDHCRKALDHQPTGLEQIVAMALALPRVFAILAVVASAAEHGPGEACSQEEGIDFWGHDLATVSSVRSAAECQLHCRVKDECRYFTWNRVNHKCMLKSSDLGRRRNEAGVSGPRACIACNQEDGIDFPGHDLAKVLGVSTPAMCQLHCQEYYGCRFFTWNKFNKDCFLKTSDITRKRSEAGVSGPRSC